MNNSLDTGAVTTVSGMIGGIVKAVSVIQNNTWYLVTITYDMQNIKFYINGIIDKVIPLNSSTPISNNFVRIGASTSGGAGFFSGKIDDIRIYNRALSQAEITYLLTH